MLMGPLPKPVVPFYNIVHSASRVLHTHVSRQETQEPEGIFHSSRRGDRKHTCLK